MSHSTNGIRVATDLSEGSDEAPAAASDLPARDMAASGAA
jgi:hypothetical protein